MRIGQVAKDAGTLISGNVLAQGVALLAYLVLTRLYTPADYGLFNIFYSYIEVLVIASTMKMELGVVSAKDDRRAAAVAQFTLRTNLFICLALLTLATILYLLGALPGKLQKVGLMAPLIPILVYFCGTSRVYEMLFNRVHQYRQMAISQLVNSTAGSLLKIFFGLTGRMHASGLPLGTVLGQMIGNINYRLRMRRLELPKTSREERRLAAHECRDFARYTAPKDLLNSLSANLPFLWLAMYFDEAEIGLFSLALTFTFRPANIVATALENVLYVRTAEKVREKEPILKDLRHLLLMVNAVAIPVAVIAYFVAEPVFGFVFGSRWAGCGRYVQMVLPWIWVMVNTNSLMFMANVFGLQRFEFVFGVILLAMRVAAILLGLWIGDFGSAILLFSLASAVVMAGLGIWYYGLAVRYERSLIKS